MSVSSKNRDIHFGLLYSFYYNCTEKKSKSPFFILALFKRHKIKSSIINAEKKLRFYFKLRERARVPELQFIFINIKE